MAENNLSKSDKVVAYIEPTSPRTKGIIYRGFQIMNEVIQEYRVVCRC